MLLGEANAAEPEGGLYLTLELLRVGSAGFTDT